MILCSILEIRKPVSENKAKKHTTFEQYCISMLFEVKFFSYRLMKQLYAHFEFILDLSRCLPTVSMVLLLIVNAVH